MSTLLIVESPAKCGKIEQYLGHGYKCMASFGHIRELTGLGSVVVSNGFSLKFEISNSKKKQVAALRQAAKSSKEVIIATDDDREGEAIGWHLCVVLGLNVGATKRILFSEITETAIRAAMKSPTHINMDLVKAQQARQALDILVGYMISPVLWNKIARHTKASLSAGRCQTPALRLIYDNQKEIENHPGELVYAVTGTFLEKQLQFALDSPLKDEAETDSFLEESVNFDHIFDRESERNSKKKAPLPFTTSSLQQQSSSELKYGPKETMKLCQTLYEGGYITYMRTDSRCYSSEFLSKCKTFIEKTYGIEYDNTDALKSEGSAKKTTGKKEKAKKDLAQEAHEAIRPTNISLKNTPSNIGSKESRLYRMIRRNTLESCMPVAEVKHTTLTVSAPFTKRYKHTCEYIVFLGWLIVSETTNMESINSEYTYLISLKRKVIIPYGKIIAKPTIRNTKQHLNEAKLVQQLEEKGIGRPSTFSSIVDKIQQRGYVTKEDVPGRKMNCTEFTLENDEITENTSEKELNREKDRLVIKQIGTIVSEFLTKEFPSLFDYSYTRHLELQLDNIAKGKATYEQLCSECHSLISEKIDVSGGREKDEIQIDDQHTYIVGKYGPVIKKNGSGKKSTFIAVRKDIDLSKLRRGEYRLEEVVASGESKGKNIGEIDDSPVSLLKGKFGHFITWKTTKRNVQKLIDEGQEITIDLVRDLLSEKKTSCVVRELGPHCSIRTGQYGDYVYFKTVKMTKPRFIPIKSYEGDYKNDETHTIMEWVNSKVS